MGEAVVIKVRHGHRQVQCTHMAVGVVLQHNAELVAAGAQGDNFLIDRLAIRIFLELGLRHIQPDTLLEGIDIPPAQRGDLTKNVQHRVHHPVLVLKLQLPVGNLDRDRVSTLSSVTRMKSVLTSKGRSSPVILWLTEALRSLNFTAGGLKILAYRS